MFLVYLDILGMLLLNSGWKAFFLLRSKKWKIFQRGKLLKCEVLFWFKIKISCLVNTRFCWISGRDQVFPSPITSSTISVSLNYLPIEFFFLKERKTPHCPWTESIYVWTAFEDLPLFSSSLTYVSSSAGICFVFT